MVTMQLFRLMYNTYNSLKPPVSYVNRQMWQQEICTLPAEFVKRSDVSTMLTMGILFLVFFP